jgi:hypothetical protein
MTRAHTHTHTHTHTLSALRSPIPTAARRNKIYEHLNLNAEQVSPYTEHNGGFDMLRSIVMVLRNQQRGHGVVAVSPRYAKQIKQKLSVFWQLSSIGRPRSITGAGGVRTRPGARRAAGGCVRKAWPRRGRGLCPQQ